MEVEDVEVEERDPEAPRVFLKKKKVTEGLNETHLDGSRARQVEYICRHDKNCTKDSLAKLTDKEVEAKYHTLEKKVSKKNESVDVKKNFETLNENTQIGDAVIVNGEKGYVIGQMGDGDLIVQVQFSTKKVNPNEAKLVGEKPEQLVKPPYDFDEATLQNLTTKALFEKYVACGIFMGNTAVKTNDCVTKYSDWKNADNDEPIQVIVEGRSTNQYKKHIKILEEVNDFADPTPYAWGIYTNPDGDSEDVLVNSLEFAGSYADAQGVTVIRNIDTTPTAVQVPKDRIQPNTNAENYPEEEETPIEPTIEPRDDVITDDYREEI